MSAKVTKSSSAPIARTECIWLAGAIFLGAVIRLSFPGRMAVEHFDEGVYASNFWFGGYSYPAQFLYAPPLLPNAIEWTMIIASLCGMKPTGFVPMIPTLVAGIAMIPSIWWVGRQWFGISAGLISAWIVATSDFHACYSRAALTDVPVCLFILWSVYFTWRAFEKSVSPGDPSSERGKGKSTIATSLPYREILLAGYFSGLAWWTKYNGWLPLAIGAAGGVLWQFTLPKADRRIRQTLICWLLISITAFAVWSPVLWSLQKVGGYAAVAANHRQYVVGLNGWGDSALKQIEHVGMYDNWLGLFTETAVVPARNNAGLDGLPNNNLMESGEAVARRLFSFQWDMYSISRLALEAGNLVNHCATYVCPVILLLVACVALRQGVRFPGSCRSPLAACLLAAWLGGMTVATPFYYPYPRLVLPWLTAVWLGIGLAVEAWRRRGSEPIQSTVGRCWAPNRVEWILIVWFVANCLVRSVQGTTHAWRDRTAWSVAAAKFSGTITEKLRPGESRRDVVVYVWGEPAMVFWLYANGLNDVEPVQNLSCVESPRTSPAFVVFGKQSYDSPDFVAQRPKLDGCTFCQLARVQTSHLVEMDSHRTDGFYMQDSEFYDASRRVIEPNCWLYRVGRQ